VKLFLDDAQLNVVDEKDSDTNLTAVRKKYPHDLKVIGLSELYTQFVSFCEDEGARNVMRRKTFKTRLVSLWYEAKRIRDERGIVTLGWRVYKAIEFSGS
jgi:hypothetical protein